MSILRHIPYAALTAGSLLVGSGAYAQSMYSIDQRQAGQQDWIRHGIRDGQLTPGEAARLERGEQAINRAQARAEADGHVSSSERRHIDNMVNRESHQIYRDQHNDRTAWGGRDGWGRDGRRDHDGWNRDADRRDWGRDHNWNGNHNGWDHSNASNRDWGRDHNWNGNHNGWNQANGQHGWNGGPSGQPGGHSWNGTPGQGGWQHGGTPTGSPTPATGSANNNSHSWGSGGWGTRQQANPQQGPRMMPASAPASQSWTQTRTTTQSYQARNTGGSGGNYSGGRSFGHR